MILYFMNCYYQAVKIALISLTRKSNRREIEYRHEKEWDPDEE